MHRCELNDAQLKLVAEQLEVQAGGYETNHLNSALVSASSAIHELLDRRDLPELKAGEHIVIPHPGDPEGITLAGDPLPRPYVVVVLPFAEWMKLNTRKP